MRETVKLISMEGFEFIIDREAAMVSQTIRSMLTSPDIEVRFPLFGALKSIDLAIVRPVLERDCKKLCGFSESKDGVVTFPDISTTILEKICQYFYWSLQYSRGKETEFHIEPELTLELMMAANYLHT
ncbi:hypothetical protein Bca101_001203 [Brassica carinata]